MEYLKCFLGKKILKHHFTVDITARPYYCLICIENAELITDKGIDHPSSKWAFLNPNTPESTDMSCIVCRTDFGIKREDCQIDGCKDNVKYLIEDEDEGDKEIWICLTCWKTEDDAKAG